MVQDDKHLFSYLWNCYANIFFNILSNEKLDKFSKKRGLICSFVLFWNTQLFIGILFTSTFYLIKSLNRSKLQRQVFPGTHCDRLKESHIWSTLGKLMCLGLQLSEAYNIFHTKRDSNSIYWCEKKKNKTPTCGQHLQKQ